MNIFKQIKQRINNMQTVSRLLQEAESVANNMGESAPGEEHLVAAALNMPDGAARRVFQSLSVDPDRYIDAIAQQKAHALEQIGIDVSNIELTDDDIEVTKPALPTAQVSAQVVLKEMARNTSFRDAKPINGADILLAVLTRKKGIAVRIFKTLGLDPGELELAAKSESMG